MLLYMLITSHKSNVIFANIGKKELSQTSTQIGCCSFVYKNHILSGSYSQLIIFFNCKFENPIFMSKKIVVLLEKFVEDSEFQYPYMRLKEEGFDVISAAPEKKSYQGKAGQTFSPDVAFGDIKDKVFDCVFIPGGYAPDLFRRHQDIVDFVKKHSDAGKIVASVCHGPWLMISAGIVRGRNVTGFFAIKDDLVNAGANYTGKDWEEDGNLLTSTNPKTMLPLMKRLVEKLHQ